MAFGFPASYETEVEVTGSRQAVRESIVRTLEQLGWNYTVNEAGNLFIARVPLTFLSFGEEFTVSFPAEQKLRIRSHCRFGTLIDWGKNKTNINRFFAYFWPSLSEVAAIVGRPPIYLDDSGKTPLERVISERADPADRTQPDVKPNSSSKDE